MKGKEAFVNALGLPRDLCLGAPVLTAVGFMEITVENHRGLLEYGPCMIRLLTGAGRIRIGGARLSVSWFGRDAMKITGRIREIVYEQAEG